MDYLHTAFSIFIINKLLLYKISSIKLIGHKLTGQFVF